MTSPRVVLGLGAAALCLGTAGCTSTPSAAPSIQADGTHQAAAGDRDDTHSDHDSHGQGGQSGQAGQGAAGHEAHEHGHASAGELGGMLIGPADLPDGYRAGHAHHAESTAGAPRTTPDCAALAELIGDHPDQRQTTHPEARAVLSKSHFGPTVGETVIDYGEQDAAADAVARLDRASHQCRSYQQSTAATGANDYRVTRAPSIDGLPGASTARLVATGRQFDIHWDLAWVQYGAQVVAVDLRTAPGGDARDLRPAMIAALSKVERADG